MTTAPATTTTATVAVKAAQAVTSPAIPSWMHQDAHITDGYRPATNSFRQCYHSLWYLHNESVNIWSHLATGIIFLGLLVWSALGWSGGYPDLSALHAYLTGVTICLFFSAFYHCVNCHSERVARHCLKLDYLGIVTNITSTCVSATYYGLHDSPQLALRYISAILLCGAGTFWAVLDTRFDGPRAAALRASIFVALGASGFAPILHAAVAPRLTLQHFALGHIFISTALYLTGTVIYVARFPESSRPGKHDIWGASHQIFHILVNLAQVSHLLGLWSVLAELHIANRHLDKTPIPNAAVLVKGAFHTIVYMTKEALHDTISMAISFMQPVYHDVAFWGARIAVASFLGLVFYVIGSAIYNLYFHPLAKYPGPRLWAVSRLPYILAIRSGRYMYRLKEFHDYYDSHIIRIAPDHLTFTDSNAWRDIYQRKQAETDFPKHHVWLRPMVNGVSSLLHAADDDHSRMKRVLGHAFSTKALRGQEEFVHHYVDLFVQRMKESIAAGENIVDIVKWYGWITFDIIGDLTFGEPFDCLKLKENHPWVTKLFSQFTSATVLATCRFFPGLETLLEWVLPRSVMELRWELFRRTQDKITQRLNTNTDRLDFLHYVEQYNDEKGMTRDEIDSTFTTLCIAAGETTSSFLSACTYFLIQHPDVMNRVTSEIRGTFAKDEEITDLRLDELPYFNAVVKETLRLCPPLAAGHPRQVPRGGRTVAGHFIPGDTILEVPYWASMRSAKNFRDPDAYLPERWLQHNGYDDYGAYMPYGLGPRGCIGRPLAQLEIRLIMARVLWNFDLQVPGGGTEVGWDWSCQNVHIVFDKRPLYVEVKAVER